MHILSLLKYIIVLCIIPFMVNLASSDISPLLQKHISLPLRYLIIILLISGGYFVYEIYDSRKHRRWILPLFDGRLDPKVTLHLDPDFRCRRPDSCIIPRVDPLLCDPEVRKMVGCYAKEKLEGACSDQIATTIPTDLGVEDVPLDFKSKPDFKSVVGSRVLYWKFELGPETSSCDLDDLSVQITQCMKRAREIDDNCTLQFGSFALLKYKDGELKWWRLQNKWIPTISHISRSPWNLSDIRTGDHKKWTIGGFNLQNTTLKASTVHRKAIFTVARHYKMQSGEDLLLCNEPQLLRDSLPVFWKELYIYASNFVEVEEGIVVPLQSQPINVTGAYWMSVLQGLINPWSMFMITSLALLSVVLGFGIQEIHNGTFGELAWVAMITIFCVALWWHRHGLLKRPDDSLFSTALTPTVADSDLNLSIDTVPPPMVESDSIELKEDMVEPGHDHLTPRATPAPEHFTNISKFPTSPLADDESGIHSRSNEEGYDVHFENSPLVEDDLLDEMTPSWTSQPVHDNSMKTSVGFQDEGFSIMLREPRPPPGITKLNDSIWEFHSPGSGKIEMEIIFLHGLQRGDFEDAFWETWLVRDSKQEIWPKKWLAERFPNARILSVTYNSRAMDSDGQLSMYALGENLVNVIIMDREQNIGQNCPVFLVGHSWGGIVIKQLLLSALDRKSIIEDNCMNRGDFERINKFYNNLRGVFYYATPHGGSRLADWVKRVPGTGPIVKLLGTLNDETSRINSNFSQIRQIPAFEVAEGLETSYKRWLIFNFRAKVVEQASSRLGIDQHYTLAGADHFSVCKANSARDPVVVKLVEFIDQTWPRNRHRP